MSLPDEFLDDLRRRFRGDIRLDLASRVLYSTDASIYQVEPLGVLLPRSQDDLHAAVESAARHGVPILPRGGGSSLAGQAIGEAVILDCSRWLNRIVEVDPAERVATVEPGVVLSDLNRAAAKHGLRFGPDPSSADRATMGGVIGNNATGAHSILYGMTADHLRSVDVVLGDGSLATLGVIDACGRAPQPSGGSVEPRGHRATVPASRYEALVNEALNIRERYGAAIKERYPRTWRNSAGYRLNYLLPWSSTRPTGWETADYPPNSSDNNINLAPLLAGSEGTLAVIRQATVGLVPKPDHSILAILAYSSIESACDAVPEILVHHPSAIELIPRMLVDLARHAPAFALPTGWASADAEAILVVEFAGGNPGSLKMAAEALRGDVRLAESASDQERVWSLRKAGLGILDSRPQSRRSIGFIEDCAIPVEKSWRVREGSPSHYGGAQSRRRNLWTRLGRLPARPSHFGSEELSPGSA